MREGFITERVAKIPPSGIRKFFDIASEMDGIISLGVGEPDFDTPWRIREEGIYSLEKGKTFYTSNSGLKELRDEIHVYMRRKFKLSYDPASEILVTVGGSEGIDLALRALINPGDEVLIPEPSFVAYKPCAVLAGATPVVIPLQEENEFKLTPHQLTSYITEKTKVLILPFPNNPTGSIMTKEELEPLVDIIIENDIFVISDEIYAELTYEKQHHSIASFEEMKEQCLVINGFSKAFAMTGWRLGFALGPSPLIKAMTKIHQYCIMCTPTTSQYAAVEALKNGDSDVEEMKTSYNQRRKFMLNSLHRIGLQCFEPRGAFYIFPSIQALGLSSEEFCQRFLFEHKVAVVPGTAFGDSGEGFIRCSYACSMNHLKIAIDEMEKFIEKIRAEVKK